jgi:hypothetical protein
MNIVNQMLLTALLFCATVIIIVAMFSPTQFGNWLQEIDNARYEFIGE